LGFFLQSESCDFFTANVGLNSITIPTRKIPSLTITDSNGDGNKWA
ncbi:unnamed protein product, partial [Musa acuminata var. zebrina]